MKHAEKKSDTFIFTVVPNADSIMLGALFSHCFHFVLGRNLQTSRKMHKKKKEKCEFHCNLSHLMPRLVFVDEIAREKGKTRKSISQAAQCGEECKLMCGAMAVKAKQRCVRERERESTRSRLEEKHHDFAFEALLSWDSMKFLDTFLHRFVSPTKAASKSTMMMMHDELIM